MGYNAILQVDVLNRGYSGYNTRWAVHILDGILDDLKQPPVLATIFFGANDSAPESGPESLQHVPLEEYRQNLITIFNMFKQHSIENALFITPSPVHDPVLEGARVNERTKQYADACIEVAENLNAPVLDLWTHLQTLSNWQTSLLSDGVHFTSDGNRAVYDALISKIYTTFPELVAENLNYDYPLWRFIDVNDSKGFFQVMKQCNKQRELQ
eukprot:TRINITY_DN24233_c0_g1_i3.p2 TRINITY_DN24233_c0_g1~~TRINITY_DN24233_c0_g1_i3.p2  ORF type:complete len:212 (-),score=23.52 TRINITY_DN24233_c0_g1_i3:783-1418(-)